MSAKRLSERDRFKDALILSSFYFANPGVNGETELGLLKLKSKIQLWVWCEDYAEVILELPAESHWRELVTEALNNDSVSAAVALDDIRIIRDRPPIGQLLGFAFSEYDQDKVRGKLLLKLSDHSILELCRFQHNGLYDREILYILDKVAESLEEISIDIDDLPEPKLNDVFNLWDLKQAFQLCMHDLTEKYEAEQRKIENDDVVLNPFLELKREIIRKWADDKPTRRYPGGGPLPAAGELQLSRYIDNYILNHGKTPTGKHLIPSGPDIFDRTSSEFEVDFDLLE